MDRLDASAVADLLRYVAGIPLPSGDIVGLDRAVCAARTLAVVARWGKDLGRDDTAPDPDVVEAALRGAARRREAQAVGNRQVSGGAFHEASSGHPTWTVDTDPLEGGTWNIRRDGHLVDTVAGRYGADEVLAVAEQYARCALAWVLDQDIDGLRSVTAAEVADLPPGRVDATRTDSPEAMSDADTALQDAAGWIVHPDIRVGEYRIVHVERGRVAIRVCYAGDGALLGGGRQVRPGGLVENTTSLAQVLAWLSAGEGEL